MKKSFVVSCLLVAFGCVSTHSQDANLQGELERDDLLELAEEAQRFGDPARGAYVFFQPELNCVRCHETLDGGRGLGPSLSEKRDVRIEHLVESVLHPSRKISKGYETVIVQLVDGEVISGVLAEEPTDAGLAVNRIEEPDQVRRIDDGDIEQWKRAKTSSMPEQLVNQLAGRQQFLDLICYLREIAENGPERAEELAPPKSFFALAPLPEYESRIDHRSLLSGLDDDAFERGEETFRLRCASCHGTKDQEGSMPTSLRFASGNFKHGNDPFTMYQTLTHGFGMMNSQRWMVPQQKYEVIHYIREHFLKDNNPKQYFEISEDYLEGLPAGDTIGPEPKISRPWTEMDYGPSLNNTVEVSGDGSNIAQKGIVVRLDSGPGGAESGSHWLMYDHDTMRCAAVWSGQFIDYNGIHFNGVHGRHPRIAGELSLRNPVGPGWGRPDDGSFEDERQLGRDGKRYGPLQKSWLNYHGLYRFGKKTLLKYSIGNCEVIESPAISFVEGTPVVSRQFHLEPRDHDLILQVLRTDNDLSFRMPDRQTMAFNAPELAKSKSEAVGAVEFNGSGFAQTDSSDFEMTEKDFSIYAEINTDEDGTIFSQTSSGTTWVPNGKTFFIRDGGLHFDIGWVGVVESEEQVVGEGWRAVGMTWNADSGRVKFFVDGELKTSGKLKPEGRLQDAVQRIGFTNDDFPSPSSFAGRIRNFRFYSRRLAESEFQGIDSVDDGLVTRMVDGKLKDFEWVDASRPSNDGSNLLVNTTLSSELFDWVRTGDGDLRMRIHAGQDPIKFALSFCSGKKVYVRESVKELANSLSQMDQFDLHPLLKGGPANWPDLLATDVAEGKPARGFQVDVIKRPTENPWNDRLRITGIDFFAGGQDAAVCCWDGSVYRVEGLDEESTGESGTVTWRRIAAGLFQPLGIRIVDEKIYVTCRDQLVRLHDLDGDGEMDFYENFNSDHQVTEHFHEFAMGLQTDEQGNFYYAKSARHALPAVVPHHGTLLKVASDGSSTQIVANGFRAANGVCLNPDGSFVVTDQEGHWNPKNRINWVRPGGFYGNMYGFHDVVDSSDEAMDQPLCWITNAFDRSPGELIWVTSKKWGRLHGSLLNLSYGTGQIYVVPHEHVGDQVQGGMCAFPIKRFPTGIMRGRFNPSDGQLYCCGMFAWAGDQQQPGGLYRVRCIDEPMHLPVQLRCFGKNIQLAFTDEIAQNVEPADFRIDVWSLKRTKNYGSKHYNEKTLKVTDVKLLRDRKTVVLEIPDLNETWCMKIRYSLKSSGGEKIIGEIHNTIHDLGGTLQ